MRLYLQIPALQDKPPRFYQLILQADLIGGWTLIRESGYQGKSGRVQRSHFESYEGALEAMMTWRDKQINRGFKVVFMKGMDVPQ
ncbi:MAG: WGR domain-containing protein [Thiohalomonadales bacterium]